MTLKIRLLCTYTNAKDRNCCDNYRGISLLSIAGKILARLDFSLISSKTSKKSLNNRIGNYFPLMKT